LPKYFFTTPVVFFDYSPLKEAPAKKLRLTCVSKVINSLIQRSKLETVKCEAE
jgi:hypothetical protein